MKEKRRGARRWIWLGALAVLIVVCVLFYHGDGLGGGITDIPGGFFLDVYVLEGDGSVTRCDVRDESRIQAVQHYIRTQKSARLRATADARPAYPYLGFSDGTRQAVYTNGVWIDGMGRAYSVALDPAELLALIPDAPQAAAALREFPNRFPAASFTGTWDAKLLERSEPPQDLGELQIRARERSEDKIFVTVYNPENKPARCRTDARLEVLSDGAWYTVPSKDGTEQAEEEQLAPNSSALFTASVKETEQRYGRLPAGHYRIVLLSYDAEFDVE